MKKFAIGIAALVGIVLLSWAALYNGLISSRESVKEGWGKVQNQYQRRADLVPNLVEVVKGYAAHEKAVFEEVTRARAAVSSVDLSKVELDPAAQKQYLETQGQLSVALGKLLMIKEAYPDLKANQNFLTLQAQLEGTENRISVERGRTQKATADYNKIRQGFPGNIVAGIHGFTAIQYYEAETTGASVAPKVSF
jgi:LemA protein